MEHFFFLLHTNYPKDFIAKEKNAIILLCFSVCSVDQDLIIYLLSSQPFFRMPTDLLLHVFNNRILSSEAMPKIKGLQKYFQCKSGGLPHRG